MFLARKKIQCLIYIKNALFHFICLLYKKKRNRINLAPPVCKCVCANMAHIMQRGRVTIMDQRAWRKPTGPEKRHSCLSCCCIKSVFKRCRMFFVSARGLSLIFTSNCFRASETTLLQDSGDAFIGVGKLNVFVCGSGRKSVFHLQCWCFMFSGANYYKEGERYVLRTSFFTWFWYHAAWS